LIFSDSIITDVLLILTVK